MSTTIMPSGSLPARQFPGGMGWRTAVSIVSVFGWLSFLLLYLAFWAGGFNWGQSAVVITVSILVFIGINRAAWVAVPVGGRADLNSHEAGSEPRAAPRTHLAVERRDQ